MATIIQIKRSTGVAAPTTGDLAEGELAYSEDRSHEGSGAVLYVSSFASDGTTEVIDKIGGKYYTSTVDSFLVPEAAAVGGKLVLKEGTDNGTNKITIKAPASLAADNTYTLPSSITSGGYLTTDGSGTLSWGSITSTFTISDGTNTDSFSTGGTLTFAGTANQITTAVTDNTVTFSIPTNPTLPGNVTIGGNTIKASDGTTAMTLIDSTGIVQFANAIRTNSIKSYSGDNNIELNYASSGDVRIVGKLKVDGNAIYTSDGTLAITTYDSTGNVKVGGDLIVGGQDIKSNNGTTALTLADTTGNVTVAGDLIVGGQDIKSSNGTTALTLTDTTGAVAVAGDLTVTGNHIKSSTDTALTLSGKDVTIEGDLTVKGTTTIISSTTVTVADSLLKLAKDNTGNAVDAGLYSMYVVSATTKYAGLFRDVSDSNKFKLFKDLEVEPTTTVATGDASYAIGTLVANVTGGTVSSLYSAIAVGDGGTGATSFTQYGVLYGNSTSALSVTAAGGDGYFLAGNTSGAPSWKNTIDGGTY